jgi:hypothetical protein
MKEESNYQVVWTWEGECNPSAVGLQDVHPKKWSESCRERMTHIVELGLILGPSLLCYMDAAKVQLALPRRRTLQGHAISHQRDLQSSNLFI